MFLDMNIEVPDENDWVLSRDWMMNHDLEPLAPILDPVSCTRCPLCMDGCSMCHVSRLSLVFQVPSLKLT